ncbi:MAG TPA: hypothetical protein VI636_05745 [Candidatus Angelobacter sp.]
MGSTAASSGLEVDAIRTALAQIQEIESAYLLARSNKLAVTIIVPTKNYDVEDRICDVQLRLMDQFTNYFFDFTIVPLNGRKAADVVTPSGQLILDRAA